MELTKEQDDRAMKWLNDHNIHVMKLISHCDGIPFQPCPEDINHPNLWKPGSWMWYVNNKTKQKRI